MEPIDAFSEMRSSNIFELQTGAFLPPERLAA
jgi:hypothetical protein